MAVKIGHASIDEKGKVQGGAAGDQTGKEVCIRTWYNKPWKLLLRCKDSQKAELMAQACEKGCANPNIGYDQNQRNTLNTQARNTGYDLSKIIVPCETDCSAFMTVCAQSAGINIPYSGTNAPTTSTMRNAFLSTGLFEVLTESKYLIGDKHLKRGDILVSPGSHTVMVLENGSTATTKTNPYAEPTYTLYRFSVIMKAEHVKWLQWELNQMGYGLVLDGKFGPATEQALKRAQEKLGLIVDGRCGPSTRKALIAE